MNEVEIYETEELSINNHNNGDRYILIEKSVTSHCCFKYTIIDTKEGFKSFGVEFDCDWNRIMCETFDKIEAIEICVALNKYLENDNK